MHRSDFIRIPVLIYAAGLLTVGCATVEGKNDFSYKDVPVSKANTASGEGSTVAFRGAPHRLAGNTVRVGDPLPEARLTGHDLKPLNLTDTKGKVRIVSIVPSVDTKVCEQQTHYLSEKNAGLDQAVQLITVSVDTPFAQKRFAEEAKISNITFLSDYRDAEFGRAYGLLVPDMHVLARSVMVVDRDNVVRYLQIVPELGNLPDMEAAFQIARQISGLREPAKPSSGGSMGWSY